MSRPAAIIALFLIAPLMMAAEAPQRPNIVLILVDDMGYSDIGPYGGEIATPHLDRLAAEGMRFTQFYNCAKCTTTRAALLTGLNRHRLEKVKPNMVTLGDALRLAGYTTIMSGKWHLGSTPGSRPIDNGFDEYYGLMDGCCNFFNPAQIDPPHKGSKYRVFGHNDQLITEFPPGYYTTDAFTDHAIEHIGKSAKAGKPFFAHITYTAPHYPLHAPAEDIARYRGRYMMGWEKLREQRYQRMVEMGLVDPKWPRPDRDPKAYDWAGSNHEWEDLRMATYAAMVDRVDQNIGRLLAALRELGVEQNTAIMFLSDNGGCSEEPGGREDDQEPGIVSTYTAVGPAWAWAQNTPFRRFKSWVHEGGIATPMIVRWPGVTSPGSLTVEVGHIVDFMPTLLEMAGGEYPREHDGKTILPHDGRSLVPAFAGKAVPVREPVYFEWAGNRAVRDGEWKLVYDDKAEKRWRLYHIPTDRLETRDVSAEHPARAKAMADAWQKWMQQTSEGKGKG